MVCCAIYGAQHMQDCAIYGVVLYTVHNICRIVLYTVLCYIRCTTPHAQFTKKNIMTRVC